MAKSTKSITISQDLQREIQLRADAENRSFSQMLDTLLRQLITTPEARDAANAAHEARIQHLLTRPLLELVDYLLNDETLQGIEDNARDRQSPTDGDFGPMDFWHEMHSYGDLLEAAGARAIMERHPGYEAYEEFGSDEIDALINSKCRARYWD